MKRLVADIIVDVLRDAGVKRCYGIPGDTLNHIAGSVKRSDIRWVHVRHEEAGGFAAGADAQLTGELAACAGSCGPGSLHFINGLYDANRNGAPVVLIASQVVRDELGFDFPQEVDFKAIYGSWTVYCDEIRTPEQAQRKTVLAAQAALAEKGVAVLIVPADVSSAHVEDQGFTVHKTAPVTLPNDAELDRIAAAINAGGRVAIYAGAGCANAHDEVVVLAQRLKAPVARTTRAKDFLAHDNPFDVGMTGVLGARSGYEAVLNCDVLLLLGCGFAWRQFYPEHATIIQIDIKARNIGRRHPITLGAVGDIGPTLAALTPRLTARTDSGYLNRMLELKEKAFAKQERPAHDLHAGKPMHPQFMIETLAAHADADAVWTPDDGSAVVFCLRHVPATGRNRTIASYLHGTMAAGLSSAIGAKAAFPNRQVIAVCGDGGLAMLMGEMITLIQEKLPIKVAVLNNSSLGFVELEQRVEGMLATYTDLENPDFAKVAGAMGYWSRRVERAEDLDAAVEDWLAQPGPALLDVVTGRYELVLPPATEAKEAFGMAMYSVRAVMAGRSAELVEMAEQNFIL
ncbi:MAG: thiamine pyrophosphate-dependent enzyme [Caulobacteraceae bacterium]